MIYSGISFEYVNNFSGGLSHGLDDDHCNSNNFSIQGTFDPGDTPYYEQAVSTIVNDGNVFVVKANAGVTIRAGSSITLTPGFHAELNSYFTAAIGACDSPGGTGE